MRDEFKTIKSGKKELREFGLTIGAILVILGVVALLRAKAAYPYLLLAGFLLAALGLTIPQVLKPLQKAWMAFSIVLGFVMSRVVLAIVFYAVMTPIGLATKVFGKDILDERIDRKEVSYWKKRSGPIKEKTSYENQY